MTVERIVLGWRVPRDVWERFEEHVAEKHGATGPYLRFELELAMREYLDDDELGEHAEKLLKEHTDLRGLSSSTAPGVATGRYRGADTKKIGHRINARLKERFQVFADKHEADTYGRLLARALDSYADGGRTRRILDDVERLVTGGCTSDTTGDSVESSENEQEGGLSTGGETDTSGITVEPALVEEIAESVVEDPARTSIAKKGIDKTTVAVVGSSNVNEEIIKAYREAAIDHLGAEEHPHNDRTYITEEYRENHVIWADLEKDERLVLLRRFAAADAVGHGEITRCYTYKQVQDLFKLYAGGGGPSRQYAYDLMEEAAPGEPGFEYGEFHGQLQFRVDISEVSSSIKQYAFEEYPERAPDELRRTLDVTSYTAGSGSTQQAAADDD